MSFNDNGEQYKFKAKITYCRYYKDDTAFGVFGFSTYDSIPYYDTSDDKSNNNGMFDMSASDQDNVQDNDQDNDQDVILKFGVLAGKMQELLVGAEYIVNATIRKDKIYGYQYSPVAVYAMTPQTEKDQLIFLKSIIPNAQAENLIAAYPNIVNDVVNGKISEIDYDKVKGVREYTWNKIKDKIINNYLISDIITMLKPLGVTYTMIKKLLSDEPNPTLLKKNLEDNPYILTRIDGMGWSRVDDLALRLKPEMVDSTERLIAYTKYYFTSLGESEGHTWCSTSFLEQAINTNVPECKKHVEWLLGNDEFLYVSDDKVGLKYYHDVETKIYQMLIDKSKKQTKINISDKNIEKFVKEAEEEQGFQYTKEQRDVIEKSLHRTVSLISGKAGSGKSSILRGILSVYKKNNCSIAASALSAMAAQRITEATGYPAMTIHRTLGCIGLNKFTFNKDFHLKVNVAILDEGSMVNARLFLDWLEAIDDQTRIVICGDHKQLPPIGYGNIFSDIIEKLGDDISSKLTKVMRQAEQSGILHDANLIRENKNPIVNDFPAKLVSGELKDMIYMFRTNRQSLFDIATTTYLKSIETDGLDNVVIIVPRKKDCLNSTYEINQFIQNKLLGNEKKSIGNADLTFKLGAKVMQTVNDYDKNVFNGECGYITEIGKRQEGKKVEEYCIVTFTEPSGSKKEVEYTKKEVSTLDLAYALTGHKIQGGQRKTVICIIDNTHYQLLDNCILYTMLTRAKKRCLLLAEPQAFLKCIRTSHNRRNTWISLRKGI